MPRGASGLQLIALLLLLLSGSSPAVHNDATESVSPQPELDTQEEQLNEDTNQARNGGRRQTDAVRNGESKRLRTALLYVLSLSLLVSLLITTAILLDRRGLITQFPVSAHLH